MTALLLVGWGITAVFLVTVVVGQRWSLVHRRLKKRAVVTLLSGQAFSGVLYGFDREALVLRQAEALGVGENGSNLIVDGEVVLLRSGVDYLQLP